MLEKISSGIDIVDINRFKSLSYDENKKFYEKIFTYSEIEYCLKFEDPYSHFAAKFALKEAVIKSIDFKENLINIETSHIDSKPHVELIGENNQNYIFEASISHEKDYAVAIVLSEKTH